MEDILLIDAVERFLNGEMSPEEKIYFEDLRKNNPELDQAVVEQSIFLQNLGKYSKQRNFQQALQNVEGKLVKEGFISRDTPEPGKVVFLWQKYKKTIAVAACIAGVVSIFMSSLVGSVKTTKNEAGLTPLVVKLNEKVDAQVAKTKNLEGKVRDLETATPVAVKQRLESKFRATGFMIDAGNNYLITNAHVANEAKNHLIVENNNGEQFTAKVVYLNPENDIAIIKIIDPNFKKLGPLPYNFRKNDANLGEQIFVLGFPKQEIVYTEGYISAKNGYQMDTSFCQLVTQANVGNSGSPVINKNGEIVGVISSRETNDAGVVFAVKSVNIFRAADNVSKKDKKENIKISGSNKLRGLSRENQITKMSDYVFMIKGN